jgi:hypothetical protein
VAKGDSKRLTQVEVVRNIENGKKSSKVIENEPKKAKLSGRC